MVYPSIDTFLWDLALFIDNNFCILIIFIWEQHLEVACWSHWWSDCFCSEGHNVQISFPLWISWSSPQSPTLLSGTISLVSICTRTKSSSTGIAHCFKDICRILTCMGTGITTLPWMLGCPRDGSTTARSLMLATMQHSATWNSRGTKPTLMSSACSSGIPVDSLFGHLE